MHVMGTLQICLGFDIDQCSAPNRQNGTGYGSAAFDGIWCPWQSLAVSRVRRWR